MMLQHGASSECKKRQDILGTIRSIFFMIAYGKAAQGHIPSHPSSDHKTLFQLDFAIVAYVWLVARQIGFCQFPGLHDC